MFPACLPAGLPHGAPANPMHFQRPLVGPLHPHSALSALVQVSGSFQRLAVVLLCV